MVSKAEARKVEVSEDMKKRAIAFSMKVINETYDRFKYDLETRKRKIYLGKLGEEVLLKFFESIGFNSDIDYNIYPGTTATDETDLQINGYKIDLKVGSQEFHKRLLIVKSYFDNGHTSDFYVGINFYDKESFALIFGYATRDDIKNAPVAKWDKTNPIEDYTLLYEDLKPIEELITILRKK